MLSIQINDPEKKEYIYRQIYQQIKDEILLHHYLPHQKLPSKRELAKELNISVNSVNAAYQQLFAEGYVYAIERSGFYVEKIDAFPVPDNAAKPLDPDLIEPPSQSKADWISFSHMATDATTFPFDQWLRSEQKALKAEQFELHDGLLHHPQGIYSVRKTIAGLLSITRGVKCYPEQIVLGAGTQFLVRTLVHILPQNSTFAVEDPGYQRIYQMLKSQHAEVKTIGLDDKGLSIDEINWKNPNILYITPSHQFPTGIVMPASRRIQLLNWAGHAENRYILEDDYDSEFKYQCDTIPSLQSLDSFDKVIYMGTFSKSLLPGLRVSYMVLPQHLLRKFRERHAFLLQTCNVLTQLTLQHFIDSGEYQKHIKRMKQIYEERRTVLIDELNHRFGNRIKMEGANAGLHFVVSFDTQRSYRIINKRAEFEKLELYGMQRFYLSENSFSKKPAFILGFANLPVERIREGVARLYRAVYE